MNIKPSREDFQDRARDHDLVPLHATILADMVTPISAYRALAADGPAFLLESVEGGENIGRYSFIGIDPSETIFSNGEDPLSRIEKKITPVRQYRDPNLPRFIGGAVGYIGYDCVRYFEEKLSREDSRPALDFPEAAFMIAEKLVVFDHLKRCLIIIVNARATDYEAAAETIRSIAERLRTPAPVNAPVPYLKGTGAFFEVRSNTTREDFVTAVRKAQDYIAAGDAFQIVLSQRFEKESSCDPFEIYRALRVINPSPYMYFLNFGSFQIVGSSPEVMVRLEDGAITLRPIAGTRPRGADAEEDARLERELLDDAKECAEHIMLVDLGRNDVGRAAEPGTVIVDDLMTIERYSHVMHIVSNVTGKLARGKTVYDLIRATFPAGTVSGAPKVRAMEIIAELEPTKRGPYAGAVGYIGFDGNADTAIVLRTILVQNGRAYVQAGAGIVYDSIPENEFVETENKARGMQKAIEWAEEGLE